MLCRREHSCWVKEIQNQAPQVGGEEKQEVELGWALLPTSPALRIALFVERIHLRWAFSSSIRHQFAGQVSPSRCPNGNQMSSVNSPTPTRNQSLARVLSLRWKKWNGHCPLRCQTEPAWKCFYSLDTKPFIFGPFQYLQQCTCNTFQSTWIVPNRGSKLIFYKLLSSEARRWTVGETAHVPLCVNLLITINSHIAAPHIPSPPLSLFMWQPKLPPATSALLGEFSDQPPGRGHAAIFSLQGRACRSASWKTDVADLSSASRMQKTSISVPLLRGGNTCHFLSQLQLTCCISALIDSEPPNTAKSRFKRNSITWYYFSQF